MTDLTLDFSFLLTNTALSVSASSLLPFVFFFRNEREIRDRVWALQKRMIDYGAAEKVVDIIFEVFCL